MIRVREALLSDAIDLSFRLRRIDLFEIRACGHPTPLEALQFAYRRSDLHWTVCQENGPIAMFGVVPAGLMSTVGHPWFLGSDEVTKELRAWVELSKPYLAKMLHRYELLNNYVSEDNLASKLWLKKLGFKIEDAVPYGMYSQPFNKFEIRR
jgi:hypothetical protein